VRHILALTKSKNVYPTLSFLLYVI